MKNSASPKNTELARAWFWIPAVALVYYGAARVGLWLALENTNASPVWPPSGIGLAAVLLLGHRIWPGIFAGAFLGNITVFLQNQTPAADPAALYTASCFIGIGNTLEAVTGAFLLRRFVVSRNPFERARDVFKFSGIAFLACLASSGIGPLTLGLLEIIPWALYRTVGFTWWLGDVVGILVLTPFILILSEGVKNRGTAGSTPGRAAEFLLLFALLSVVGGAIFGGTSHLGMEHYQLSYLVTPFILWAAFRFGQGGVVLTSLAISGIAIVGTLQGFDPSIGGSRNESLILLQAFIGTVTFMGLVLGALLAERKRWEAAIQKARMELEKRVEERTAELKAVNESLKLEAAEHRRAEEEIRKGYRELERSQEAALNIMEDLDRQKKELHTANEALHKEINERLKKELELACSRAEREQLELLAFVASHDLQEPLHKIVAFGDLLKERVDGLDEKSKAYVDRMAHAAARMGQLIGDLLNFSRTALKDGPFQTVSLEKVAEDVLKDLDLRIRESRARVEIGELPTIQGDPAQMHDLFQNLIANAIKFKKKEATPHIVIRSRRRDPQFAEVTFQDNGIGFDEKYLDRIFRPFERLHTQKEYPGSGMGLAICQKIVMRHGGAITAQSEVGRGATFLITLPTETVPQRSVVKR